MAASPAFSSTPLSFACTLSTAETSRTAPTNAVLLATGPASGLRVSGVRIKAAQTTTAGRIFIWLYDGTNYFLVDEVTVGAVTASATVAAWSSDWVPPYPVILQQNWQLRLSTYVSETFKCSAYLAGSF